MKRHLFIGIFIIGSVFAQIPNFCDSNGVCTYPQGWDTCMVCTDSSNCNGQPCTLPSNGTFQYNECSYLTTTVCSCPISLVNIGCAYGSGCCRSRLQYSTFDGLNWGLGWLVAGTFYIGRYLESIFHVFYLVVGGVITFIIYMNSVNPQDKDNTTVPCPKPDCSRPFRPFWIVFGVYLGGAVAWWIIDIGLYTNQVLFDNYNIELY